MNESVVCEISAGVVTLILNRPEKLNALDSSIFLALEEHVSKIEADPERVGVVVIRGRGRCFSAGVDLKDATSGTQKVTSHFRARLIDRIGSLPCPVVAAVHGHCYTGALELALAADIIFAAQSAKFADTHGKWGLTPAWGMSQRLPRRIGRGQASRMMFTALPVLADEALAIGLVDQCVPDDRFDDAVAELTSAIAANSCFSNHGYKRLMLETDGLPLSAGLAHEFLRRPGNAPDFEQRVASFLGKSSSQ